MKAGLCLRHKESSYTDKKLRKAFQIFIIKLQFSKLENIYEIPSVNLFTAAYKY